MTINGVFINGNGGKFEIWLADEGTLIADLTGNVTESVVLKMDKALSKFKGMCEHVGKIGIKLTGVDTVTPTAIQRMLEFHDKANVFYYQVPDNFVKQIYQSDIRVEFQKRDMNKKSIGDLS